MAPKPSRRDFLRWAGSGAGVALTAFAFGGIESNSTECARVNLALPKWDADGFRVGLLADLHLVTHAAARRAKSALRWLVDEKPDVIVIAGDFVSMSTYYVREYIAEALEPTRDAQCPVLAVMGNHDYWVPNPESVAKKIQSCGVTLLRNELVDVRGVTLAGLDDALMGMHRPDKLSDARFSRSLISVLHEPDYVDEMPGHVSLQLSGHSHGGQICLPGGISLHTPLGAKKYIAGFYPEATVPLYVSRGVGTMGPALRTFCRPEVTVLTLRGA